eukprot:Awhi_evm1s13602
MFESKTLAKIFPCFQKVESGKPSNLSGKNREKVVITAIPKCHGDYTANKTIKVNVNPFLSTNSKNKIHNININNTTTTANSNNDNNNSNNNKNNNGSCESTSKRSSIIGEKKYSEIISEYNVIETLHVNKNGKVQLATSKVTGEKYILKHLFAHSEKEELAILNEVHMSQLLSHEGVVEFLRIGSQEFRPLETAAAAGNADNTIKKWEKHFILVQEFMEGGDLYNLIVIDFGLSQKLIADKRYVRRVGTSPYMAKELWDKTGNCEFKSVDMWAIGVIFYVMMCGRFPWAQANETSEEFRSFLAGNLQKEEIWLGLPKYARDILEKIFDLDPKKRLTINELITQLNVEVHRRKLLHVSKSTQLYPRRSLAGDENNNSTSQLTLTTQPNVVGTSSASATSSASKGSA